MNTKIVVDCLTDKQTIEALSSEEEADFDARAVASADVEVATQEAKTQRASDLAIVLAKADKDPEFAALCRLLLLI